MGLSLDVRAASSTSFDKNVTPIGVVRPQPPVLPPVATTSGVPTTADLDRRFHAFQRKFSGGLSLSALMLPTLDWINHLENAPFRQVELYREAQEARVAMVGAMLGGEKILPAASDKRFSYPGWQNFPFSMFEQAFLLTQRWVESTTTQLAGLSPEHERSVSFWGRQWFDMFSPSNIPLANPEVIDATRASGGRNLIAGMANLIADFRAMTGGAAAAAPGALVVGRDLAVTPGKVIYRNALFELIQYTPTTATVHAEPILIVPAWIMKYYILDLSPENSLIRHLVENGHTVFCISWHNPGVEMRDTSFDSYRSDALMSAIDTIAEVCGAAPIHACGYCLGGTLLTIAAATMAREGDARLGSITLLAAQTDFSEPGELQLFTSEAQIADLEAVMSVNGFLSSMQMGGTFELLRSRDLLWSRQFREYVMGEREHLNDLMTWNADGTRLPARMQSEYLRAMYLHNDLASDRYEVEGRPVALGDIRIPAFVVSTETDHVAPWRSVFKIHQLVPAEITFVLTSGGHNAGIVSEPGHPRRHFKIATRAANGVYQQPAEWEAQAPRREGSWWTAWLGWLDARSGPQDRTPPSLGAPAKGVVPIADAPGAYVLEH